MAEDRTERTEESSPPQDIQPGGRSSRGPNPSPGGNEQLGGLVPPYEGRSTERGSSTSARAAAESVETQLAEVKEGRHGSTASPSSESPVDEDELTDEVPDSPKGVGVSYGRRGENMGGGTNQTSEKGRREEAPDASGRPAGTSDPRDSTSIDPG